MSNLTSKAWWAAAGTRAIKTAAQVAVTLIGTGAVGITDLDWARIASVAFVSAVVSLLTSLGGLPEVSTESTTASTPAAVATTSDETATTSNVIGTVSVDVPVVVTTEAATATGTDGVAADGKGE